MKLDVQLFATARELAGASVISVELETGSTVAKLKQKIARQVPDLEPLMRVSAVAVEQEYATPETVITEGVEIALIPPVSGG